MAKVNNNILYNSRNMKRTIKLKESELKQMIAESVKRLLNESFMDDLKTGWVLVMVDRFPLGFGKLINGTLKNKYLPGWRMI